VELTFIAGHDDFHCLSSADGTQKTHYTTTGRDLDSYTLHFTVRPRHETDFYTYCFLHFTDNAWRPDEGEEFD